MIFVIGMLIYFTLSMFTAITVGPLLKQVAEAQLIPI